MKSCLLVDVVFYLQYKMYCSVFGVIACGNQGNTEELEER